MELITLLIAIYGAALSTLLAILSIKRDKRGVKITCRVVERTKSSDGIDSLVVGIKAVNTGHRNVTLEYAGFRTKGGKYFTVRIQERPVVLKDGDPITIRVSLDEIEGWLKETSPSEYVAFAYVMDVEGTKYKTSTFPKEMVERNMARPRFWKKQ